MIEAASGGNAVVRLLGCGCLTLASTGSIPEDQLSVGANVAPSKTFVKHPWDPNSLYPPYISSAQRIFEAAGPEHTKGSNNVSLLPPACRGVILLEGYHRC